MDINGGGSGHHGCPPPVNTPLRKCDVLYQYRALLNGRIISQRNLLYLLYYNYLTCIYYRDLHLGIYVAQDKQFYKYIQHTYWFIKLKLRKYVLIHLSMK